MLCSAPLFHLFLPAQLLAVPISDGLRHSSQSRLLFLRRICKLSVLDLPADLGHVLVDAVEGLEHDDCVSADDDHADAHLLVVGFLF